MLRQFLVLAAVAAQCLVLTNGLTCIHCRLDLCQHPYCAQSTQLFNSSAHVGEYVEIDEWEKIPICPEKLEERNTTQFIQTCAPTSTSCGFFNYKIITNIAAHIVPGEKAVVPVVGGTPKSFESSVVALGCVKPTFKCKTGLMNAVNVLEEKNATSSTNDTIVSRIQNLNRDSNCCKCEQDYCNNNDKSTMNDCIVSVLNNGAINDSPAMPPIPGLSGGANLALAFPVIAVVVAHFA